MRVDLRFILLLLCFFLSGFAALLYETAWAREFAFVFGTSEFAVVSVLAPIVSTPPIRVRGLVWIVLPAVIVPDKSSTVPKLDAPDHGPVPSKRSVPPALAEPLVSASANTA